MRYPVTLVFLFIATSIGCGFHPASRPAKEPAWQNLFDGKSLANWKSTQFGGEGDVHVADGSIVMGFGHPMTGITWQGERLPTNNYELQIEAQRTEGLDFFCTVTFPVDDAFCSFVVGGWGGSVCGISSIDHMDASENETTDYVSFKNGQWYTVRVMVTPGRIRAWIDDRKSVDVEVESDRLSTRIEVDLSKPMGISCFDSEAKVRMVRLRKIGGR